MRLSHRLLLRFAILLAAMLIGLFTGHLGWLDRLWENPLGLAVYWAYVLGFFAWMVFGVYLPTLEYLSQQNHPVARALTFGYRFLKAYRRK